MRSQGKTFLLFAASVTALLPAASYAQSDCAFSTSQFGRTPSTSQEMIRLQTQLIDPEFPVTQQFVMKIATEEGRDGALAQLSQSTAQAEPNKADSRNQEWPDPYGKYLDLLTLVVPGKKGDAQAQSFQTIAENQFLREAPMPAAAQRCLQRAAEDIFPTLPFETQWTILFDGDYWLLASPGLTAYLQRLYESLDQRLPEQAADTSDSGEQAAPSGTREPDERTLRFHRTEILKRIYEASPDVGREMILAEVASESPRADIEALKLLPDEELPSLDATFAEQLPAAYNNDDYAEYNAKIGAIERYGTAAVLPAMKSLYLNDPDDRNGYHSFVFFSYFLRTDADFGTRLIAAWLARPRANRSVVLFTEMAGIRLQPALRELAKKYLDDPDKWVAGNAAYLFKWDNGGAENLLWQHLETWHQEWASKNKPIPFSEQQYEDGLVEALLFGTGPCPPQDVVERLRPLYIKENSVDGNISLAPLRNPVTIAVASYNGEQELLFSVDSCSGRMTLEELEKAILRFPARTAFEWHDPANPQRRALIDAKRLEIERLVKQQGMSFHVFSLAGGIIQGASPQPAPQP